MQTPFLGRGTIVRSVLQTPAGGEVSFLGRTACGCVPLRPDEGAFNEFIASAGVDVSSAASRAALALVYLEVVHGARPLGSIEDLELELSAGTSEGVREGLRRRYGSLIRPVEADGAPPWNMVVHGLRGQALVRVEIEVAANGQVRGNVRVLEDRIPVPLPA